MGILSTVLIIYAVFVLFVAVTKFPIIWNMGKLKIMAKMFKGERNLQIFLVVWAVIVGAIGIIIR